MLYPTRNPSFRPLPPAVDHAPGLRWRLRGERWEAKWKPDARLVRVGYLAHPAMLWRGRESDLTVLDRDMIALRCQSLRDDMLAWQEACTAPKDDPIFDGTIRSLIAVFKWHSISRYQKIRYRTRRHYDCLFFRIESDHGDARLEQIKSLQLMQWHEHWCERGITMAHGLMERLRALIGFGVLVFEDPNCIRIKAVLGEMKFPMSRPRTERLTAEQANLIRMKAHELGWHSIALAQAFQFECTLRQKDVVGEWVPIGDKSPISAIDHTRGQQWGRGLLWEEIDHELILRHVTSKRQKPIEVNLQIAPMVMEELSRLERRPTFGPVLICERTGKPWDASAFRRQWRQIATACGIPLSIYNMDTRAGAISEATDAGAELEHVRHAAAHSDIAQTQKYSRGSVEKVANVMKKRVEYRNASLAVQE